LQKQNKLTVGLGPILYYQLQITLQLLVRYSL